MGSWLWSLLGREYEVVVYETDIEICRSAPEVPFLTKTDDILRFRPDLLLNCVSITSTISVFTEMVSLLPQGCMLADIASVKGELKEYYINSGRRFVSLHPMFGPTFSDMNSPGGRNAYIISESDSEGKAFFKNCFENHGIVIREVSFTEHDKLMASILSVPVLTALVFSSAATEKTIAGTTYDLFLGISGKVMNESSELLLMILKNSDTKDKIAMMTQTLSDIAEIAEGASEPEFRRLIRSLHDQSG